MKPAEASAETRTPATLYCDESGNTGSNHIDPDQPYYVLAGLLVPDDDVPPLAALVHRLGLDAAVQTPEVKAGALIKTFRGRPALGQFLSALADLNVAVFVSVYEKRFGICARIVDDCFDGAYNSRVDIGLMNDPLWKQRIANRLYEALGDEALREWADAWRRGERDGLPTATRNICAALRKARQEDLAFKIEGALKKVEEWSQRASALESINLPVWVDLLMRVEYFCWAARFGPVNIIHDEIPQFDAAYQEVLRIFQGGRPRVYFGNHGAAFVSGLRRLTTYQSESSKSCVLLQAADAVASSIGGFLKEASVKGSIDPVLEPIDACIRYLATISTFVIGVKHLNLIVAESKVASFANLPRAAASAPRRQR